MYKYAQSRRNRGKIKENIIYSVLVVSFFIHIVALSMFAIAMNSFVQSFNAYISR